MKIMLKSRKGVSPVIAALLLIAISVAAAVITYSWVMTMIDTQGKQAQTAIRFEDVTIDYAGTDSQLKINIRNAGSVTASIQTLYIYDGDTRMVKLSDIAHAIPAGQTHELGFTGSTTWEGSVPEADDVTKHFSLATNFVTSHAYKIKIVTDNGFTIEATYYSPSEWLSG